MSATSGQRTDKGPVPWALTITINGAVCPHLLSDKVSMLCIKERKFLTSCPKTASTTHTTPLSLISATRSSFRQKVGAIRSGCARPVVSSKMQPKATLGRISFSMAAISVSLALQQRQPPLESLKNSLDWESNEVHGGNDIRCARLAECEERVFERVNRSTYIRYPPCQQICL
jgi:hypothetical protein